MTLGEASRGNAKHNQLSFVGSQAGDRVLSRDSSDGHGQVAA